MSDVADLWSRTYQVGVVVRDMERAVAYFERVGLGPFTEGPSAHTVERRIYGRAAPDVEVRGALSQVGHLEFELLQPISGNSIQGEFLINRGEGVVHLCAHTDDLERDIKRMSRRGFSVISFGRLEDGGQFAYFDTRAVGGIVFELFESGSEWS